MYSINGYYYQYRGEASSIKVELDEVNQGISKVLNGNNLLNS